MFQGVRTMISHTFLHVNFLGRLIVQEGISEVKCTFSYSLIHYLTFIKHVLRGSANASVSARNTAGLCGLSHGLDNKQIDP